MNVIKTAWAALSVAATTACSAAEPAPFTLASGGRAQAVVVACDGDTNGVGYAADRLAHYLGRISGAVFMVSDKPVPGFKTILVGAPYKATRPQETCVRVKDAQTLEVTGDGPLGTAYAAYGLVERFGAVFCAHDFEFLPSVPELSLPGDYEEVDAPFMIWREAGCEIQFNNYFEQAMRLRLLPNVGDPRWKWFDKTKGHTIGQTVCTHYVPRDKFAEAHPDWYALRRKDGKRNFHWVCVSNEEMLQELYAEIDKELSADPAVREISVGIDDGYTYCECDKCQELVRRYADPDGSLRPSMQCVVLANKVGDHFAQKYPGVRFNFLGYDGFGDSLPRSPGLVFSPNVGAGVAELWRNHGLPTDVNERSVSFYRQLVRMSNEKNGLYIWDYLANFKDFILPFPNHRIFGQTARHYKADGVRGVFCQTQFCTTLGDMAMLNLWLFSKLLWNPDLDIDALTDKYIAAAYGPGARFIREYLDLLEHARLRQRGTWFGCYVGDTSHYLTGDDCVKILRALDGAVGATRNRPEATMARRARIAGLDMALGRYNDMIEPAARLGYKLAPRKSLYEDWRAVLNAEFDRGAYGELGEGSMIETFNKRFEESFKSPAQPTVYPRRSSVIHIPASKITGGRRMTKQRDKDGVEYAQLKVKLYGEAEPIWMNTDFAEIGYNTEDADAGWWYAFATVRIGATVECDPAAAYIGIYQPWYINDYKAAPLQEVVDLPIQARGDERGWRTICLGKRRFCKGSRLWVMPGILNSLDFIDVREFLLVDPALVEGSVSAAK